MRVILLQDIRGVGKKNDTKEFKDGYARNFLILKGLAKPATEPEIKKLQEENKRRSDTENHLRLELTEFAEKISAEPLKIAVSANGNGELFAAVNEKTILQELRKKYGDKANLLDKTRIKLDKPVKSIGEHKIKADLGLGASADIILRLQP